jgi:hypothetical protein
MTYRVLLLMVVIATAHAENLTGRVVGVNALLLLLVVVR